MNCRYFRWFISAVFFFGLVLWAGVFSSRAEAGAIQDSPAQDSGNCLSGVLNPDLSWQRPESQDSGSIQLIQNGRSRNPGRLPPQNNLGKCTAAQKRERDNARYPKCASIRRRSSGRNPRTSRDGSVRSDPYSDCVLNNYNQRYSPDDCYRH